MSEDCDIPADRDHEGMRRSEQAELDDPGDPKLDSAHGEALRRIDQAEFDNSSDLSLTRLRLGALPQALRRLTRLTSLDLSFMDLEELPDWLGELTDIRVLILNGNPISWLPSWISSLPALGILSLVDTRIDRLPTSLGYMSRLTTLYLPRHMVMPPTEITQQGTTAVLGYLRSLEEEQGGEEQWRCKVVIAGEAKAGKTSLVRALLDQPHDPAEPMTHGVNVFDIVLPHPDGDGVFMHLSTWDFGGQRTYRSAHRFYMTDQSLFLLVFNCREEWDDRQMREWLKAISARAGSSPILLVGTNAREHRHGLPVATLHGDFPQIVPQVFYVDCEPSPGRSGIEELRDAMARHAAQLPLMGVRWPKSWLNAVESVSALPGDYAPWDTVDQTILRAGLDDAQIRSSLLAALHYRGEVLHFADEPEIADTVVLRPTWVDGHVTKILDSVDVHARDGLLSNAELKNAWPRTDPALRNHLIGLMEAFDLAYRVDSPNHDDVCLIVDRLPHDPPSYRAIWDTAREEPGADEVRIVIDFDGPVLLAGIPTWFIAREHRFTVNLHWRYGALLYDRFDSGCHALLVADDARGTVELTARGVAPVRFLSVLKDGLLSPLRQRYPYLTWKIKVPCPCRDRAGEQCGYLFDETYLQKVAARDRATVECQETLAEVSVERLVYGLRAAPLTRIAHQIRTIDQKIDKVALLQLKTLDHLRMTTAIQQAQAESCPSVFTLTKRTTRVRRKTTYTMRLFCEQPGAWHPLPKGRGVFTFAKMPEWIAACAPYLRVLLPILERALPLFGPVAGVTRALIGPEPSSAQDYVAELWSDKRLADELDIMKQFVDTLPNPGGRSAAADVAKQLALGDHAPLRRAHDLADFRALRGSLETLASAGSDPWGGLTPMVTPEGLSVFVCEYHSKQYRYPRET